MDEIHPYRLPVLAVSVVDFISTDIGRVSLNVVDGIAEFVVLPTTLTSYPSIVTPAEVATLPVRVPPALGNAASAVARAVESTGGTVRLLMTPP
jgi:hypothetical protein